MPGRTKERNQNLLIVLHALRAYFGFVVELNIYFDLTCVSSVMNLADALSRSLNSADIMLSEKS